MSDNCIDFFFNAANFIDTIINTGTILLVEWMVYGYHLHCKIMNLFAVVIKEERTDANWIRYMLEPDLCCKMMKFY